MFLDFLFELCWQFQPPTNLFVIPHEIINTVLTCHNFAWIDGLNFNA